MFRAGWKLRHLLHRELHGRAQESNRLKISAAPAECMRVSRLCHGKAETEWRTPCISNMPGRRQNMPPEGQKCQLKLPGRRQKLKLNGVEPSMSNLPGRREHAACRSKMPAKTWQGDEWRKPCISNMPSRRQKRPPEGQKKPPEGQKFHPSMSLSLHPSEICMSLSLSPYLSIYRSIYLSVKLARPTWTCNLQVKNAS